MSKTKTFITLLFLLSSCKNIGLEFQSTRHLSWSDEEINKIKSLAIQSLPPLPENPSNAYANHPIAAELGQRLFFDKQFSTNGQVACASCHQVEKSFTDGLSLAKGIDKLNRHTPSIVGTAYNSWFYWDGRRDSQWAQALTPFETVGEMGGNRVEIVKQLLEQPAYYRLYAQVFGVTPQLPNHPVPATPRGNEEARNNWNSIPRQYQEIYNLIFSNLGKAIAAYERKISFGASRFDQFAADVIDNPTSKLLSEEEKLGLKLFISDEIMCMRCHNGPMFSNFGFHNIGIGKNNIYLLNLGRAIGMKAVVIDEFNCAGAYSDAAKDQCFELNHMDDKAEMTGAFKVPSLRNVALTGPYMHDGSINSLEDVITHYQTAPKATVGSQELIRIEIDSLEKRALIAFLRTLTSPLKTDQKDLLAPINQ